MKRKFFSESFNMKVTMLKSLNEVVCAWLKLRKIGGKLFTKL